MSLSRGAGLDAENDDTLSIGIRHLLVIGIDAYANGIPRLNNAVRDARRFAEAMKHYGFAPEHSRLLLDEQATRKAILKAFDDLRQKLGPEDELVLYFSGHGLYDQATQSGYWIPVDGVEGERSTFLPNEEVLKLIRNARARHILGIVDSCFSASLFVQRSLSLSETTRRLYSIPSRWLMTSGRLEPVSDGSLGDHSPFAASLLTHLEANRKQALGIAELWLQMREGVISNAKQTPRCEPLQNAHHMGGEFFFLQEGAAPPKEIVRAPEGAPTLVLTDKHGNETLMRLDELEQKGYRRQAELLVRKLHKIQEALILEDDPTRQMRFELQVEQTEKQLERVRQMLES